MTETLHCHMIWVDIHASVVEAFNLGISDDRHPSCAGNYYGEGWGARQARVSRRVLMSEVMMITAGPILRSAGMPPPLTGRHEVRYHPNAYVGRRGSAPAARVPVAASIWVTIAPRPALGTGLTRCPLSARASRTEFGMPGSTFNWPGA